MFGKKKETKLEEVWLSDRWYIDIRSKPYLLCDSKGMIENGKPYPLSYCCRHALGTDGICNDCWNELFEAGLKAILKNKDGSDCDCDILRSKEIEHETYKPTNSI